MREGKRTRRRKSLSLLLAATMVFSSVSIDAFALTADATELEAELEAQSTDASETNGDTASDADAAQSTTSSDESSSAGAESTDAVSGTAAESADAASDIAAENVDTTAGAETSADSDAADVIYGTVSASSAASAESSDSEEDSADSVETVVIEEESGTLAESETLDAADTDSADSEDDSSITEEYVETETYIPDADDLADNDELFAGYVDSVLYPSTGLSLLADYGASYLDGIDLDYYYALKEKVTDLAANGGSTVLSFAYTVEEETSSTESISERLSEIYAEYKANTSAIIDCLLVDCPYELYWYDKTEGIKASYTAGYSYSYSYSAGAYIVTYKITVTFTMYVSSDYQDSDADSSSSSTTVDAEIATAASTAAATAQSVVDQYASSSDADKLTAYKEYICSVVSYNDEAADESYTGGYGDPWQLIYVFDDDSNTNVVCEGYSKAFQYLCDLTDFDNDITCYTVDGTMSGGTGAGAHMWNILSFNGVNYLVDVTNSDTGTVGQSGGLFLAGYDSGSYSAGYSFSAGNKTITYVYSSDTISLYGEDILTLSASDYTTTYVTEVTIDGTTTQYESLKAALSAARGNTATITLLADVETTSTIYIYSDDDITITSSDEDTYSISAGQYISNFIYLLGGSLTLDGVTVNNTALKSSGTAGKALYVSSGTLTLTDTTVNAGVKAIYATGGMVSISGETSVSGTTSAIEVRGADVTISGGTFDGEDSYGLYITKGSLALSGGTFTGGTAAIATAVSDGTLEDLLADGYLYYQNDTLVTDASGTSLESTATVLAVPVTITAQPEDIAIDYTESATLSVTVETREEDAQVTYQWYEVTTDGDGNETASAISGATAASYTVSGLEVGIYTYYCEISCEGYSVTSDSAEVTVTAQNGLSDQTLPEDTTLAEWCADADAAIALLPNSVTYLSAYEEEVTASITWSCADYDPAPDVTNIFTWTADTSALGDYDLTVITQSGSITVTNAAAIEVTITGTDTEVTYDGSTIDLSTLFTIDENAGEATYTVTAGTGAGTFDAETLTLTVTKAGTFTITVETAAYDAYAAGSASAILTVKKGEGSGSVSLTGWTYSEDTNTPVLTSETNGTDDVTYLYESTDGAGYSSSELPTDVGTYKVTVIFAGTDLYESVTVEEEFTITAYSLENASVSFAEESYSYTGSEITPAAVVTANGIVLTEDTDYTVTYEDNTDAGTSTVTVTGIGNYCDTATATFEITEAEITDLSAAAESVTAPEALADVQTSVTDGIDYTAAISWSPAAEDTYDYNTAYTATLTLTAKDNYAFADEAEFTGADDWTVASADEDTVVLTQTYAATRQEALSDSDDAELPEDTDLDAWCADADTVIGGLPETVSYTDESGAEVTVSITWSCEDYDSTPGAENTFTWTVDTDDLEDYDIDEITLSGSITVTNAAAIEVEITGTDTAVAYDGSTIDISALFTIDANAGTATYTVTAGTGEGTFDAETQTLTVTKAGTFTITVETAAIDAYAAGSASAVLTVEKGEGSASVSMASWSYGEDAADPVPESETNGTDSVTYFYESTDGAGYSSGEAPTTMGTYQVTATFAETDLYESCTATAEFAITAYSLVNAEITLAEDSYTYTGSTITPEVTVTAEGAELSEGTDYTVTYTDNTDVGTATVTVTGSGSYSGELTAEFTITAAEITDLSAAAESVTTPEALAEVQTSVTDGTGYTAELSWSPAAEDTYDYNTAYTATLTLTAGSNYKFADEEDLTGVDGWTIDSADEGTVVLTQTFAVTRLESLSDPDTDEFPADCTLDAWCADASAAAAQLPETITYTDESGEDVTVSVTFSCEDYDSTPSAENTFTWTVDTDDLADYDIDEITLSGSITVTNAAALEVEITGTDTEVIYDGSEIDVTALFDLDENAGEATYTVTAGTGEGTFDEETLTLTVTKAGTFTITVETAAIDAYAAGSASAVLTVEKGEGSGSVSIEDWAYGDEAAEPAAESETNGTDDVTYFYESTDDAGYSSSEAPTAIGTYSVTATFAETDLYESCTAEAEFEITKKDADLSVSVVETKTYGDEDFTLETVVDEEYDGVLTYTSSDTSVLTVDESGNVTIVGVGTAVITITASETSTYTGTTTEISITVEKKDGTLTVTEAAYTVTYGDDSFTISGISSDSTGEVTYTSSDTSVVTVDETGTVTIVGAGTAVITITAAEDSLYTEAQAEVTITVSPKEATVTTEDATKTYGDADPEIGYTAEGLEDGDELTGITVIRVDGEDVGSYEVSATQEEDANPNYNITFMTSTLLITAKNIEDATVTLGDALTANGEEQTQTIASITVTNALGETIEVTTYEVEGNTGTEAGTYTMTITGTGNFTGSISVTFEIAEAIDTEELEALIAEAEALAESDYTAESWAVLAEVLAEAEEALEALESQSAVDTAAEALAAAIAALEEAVVIDTAQLEALIAEAKALTESDYTAASWADLEDALADAQEALQALESQEAVDEAAEALEAAIAALEKASSNKGTGNGGQNGNTKQETTIDTSALEAAIAEAGALTETDYTAESWAVLAEALTAGEEALAAAESQEAIDAAAETLAAAIAALEEAADDSDESAIDTAELEKLIEEAKALTEADYTAASWAVLAEALAAGEEALAAAESQEAVDEAAETLAAAIAALEEAADDSDESTVDTAGLEELIEEAKALTETDYTAASWAVLAEALAAGEEALAAAESQEAVDAAAEILAAAIAALEEAADDGDESTVDTAELEALIAEAKALTEADYTAASWAVLAEALAAGEEALAAAESQEAVDAAAKTLAAAIAALVEAAEDTGNGDHQSEDTGSEDEELINGLKKTGDSWYWYVNSEIVSDYTGLVKNDETYGGVAGWYYVKNGKVDFTYTGLVKHDATYGGEAGWYYVVNGKADFTITDVVYNPGTYGVAGWWYVKNAKVDFSYTGLVKHSANYGGVAGWYYVTNAKVDFSVSGLVYNPGTYGTEGWWYVRNACVDFTFTGLFRGADGDWYYIKHGALQDSVEGLVFNNGTYGVRGWWYVKNGKVQFGYTGAASNANGTWFVKNGMVDFSYSGNVKIAGKTYTVKNGQVQ